MQIAVVLFVGILSVVRATPFDLDSVNWPTPFWYTFRVESDEFGNDAFSDDSEHENVYKFGSFESSENSNRIDEADEGKSMKGLSDLFGDLKQCDIITLKNPGKEGCIYVVNGNIILGNVLSTVDIEDVDAAFEEAGIEECEVEEGGSKNVPKGGCFIIDEEKEGVFWIGAFDDEVIYEEDKIVEGIKNLFDTVEKCDFSARLIPKEGCAMFDETGIHYFSVLHDVKLDEFDTTMSKLDLPKCIYDKDIGLTTKEPCYLIFDMYFFKIAHFLNLHGRFKITQDDDDDDDDQHYSEKTYEIPDPQVHSSPSLVQIATRGDKLHLLNLGEKGLFNQRSSVDKKAKDVPPKKTTNMDVKTNENNVDSVNNRPKWMKYFQTNL